MFFRCIYGPILRDNDGDSVLLPRQQNNFTTAMDVSRRRISQTRALTHIRFTDSSAKLEVET